MIGRLPRVVVAYLAACVAAGFTVALELVLWALIEPLLQGRPPGLKTFREAAEAAAEAVDPMEDIQSDAEYRRDLVRAVTRRALERAA